MPKTKPTKAYEKKLYIDMDFEEALERFGTTDPKDLPDNIKLSQKRKPGSQKPPDHSKTRRSET
jgi:hypothetical protein